MSAAKHIYAIGINKDWIELREAKESPRLHKSEFNRLMKRQVWVINRTAWPDYSPGHYVIKPYMKKFTSLTYTGGKVVKTMKSRRFAQLMNISIRPGGIVQLLPDAVKLLLEEDS